MNMTPEIEVALQDGSPVYVERMPDGGARFRVPADAGYRVAVISGGATGLMAVASQVQPSRTLPRQTADGNPTAWLRDRFGRLRR